MFSRSLEKNLVLKEVEKYKELMNFSLDKLLNALFLPGLRNRKTLTNLAKNKIWEAAYYLDDKDNPDRIMSYDITLLREECKQLSQSIAV